MGGAAKHPIPGVQRALHTQGGTKVTTADVTKAQLTGFLLGGGPIVCHRGQSGTEGDRRNYPTGRHYHGDHTGDGHDRRSGR